MRLGLTSSSVIDAFPYHLISSLSSQCINAARILYYGRGTRPLSSTNEVDPTSLPSTAISELSNVKLIKVRLPCFFSFVYLLMFQNRSMPTVRAIFISLVSSYYHAYNMEVGAATAWVRQCYSHLQVFGKWTLTFVRFVRYTTYFSTWTMK